jgi:hypothetical protein
MASLILLAGAASAPAATVTVAAPYILYEGEIEAGDAVRMETAIRTVIHSLHAAGLPQHITIRLKSPGGNIDAANAITRAMFRYRTLGGHLTTLVAHGGYCASACVLLFATGQDRIVAGNGSVEVHRASRGLDGAETAVSVMLSAHMSAALARFGAPVSVGEKLLQTSPSTSTAVTDDELRAWGAVVKRCWNASAYDAC